MSPEAISAIFEPEWKIETLMGLPFAARDPRPFRNELAIDAYEFLRGVQNFVAGLERQLENQKLMRPTRQRLKKIRSDYQLHLETMSELLKPLGYETVTATTYNRWISRKAKGHRVAEYYSHLCKDWSWGGFEAERALEIVKACVGEGVAQPKSILVLGPGACRLPYEIHRWVKPEITVCVDVNPILLACAKRVIEGERLSLVEFPAVPKDMNSFSLVSALLAPEPVEGMEFIVSDLSDWGLREGTFDWVVTPWFIDVAPIDSPRLFSQINSVLKPGGKWINYGPTLFNKIELVEYMSPEEVVYLAGKSGFEVTSERRDFVPHMQNPAAGQHRSDHVLTFVATKVRECDSLPTQANDSLPDWLTDLTRPIRLEQALDELQMSLSFTLDLSMKAQGGLSVRELAQVLANRHGLAADQAEQLIVSTLKLWISTDYNPMRESAKA